MMSYFLLGVIDIDDDARTALGRVPLDLIAGHAMHEHGHLTNEEHMANRQGAMEGGEIISRYRVDPTSKKPKSLNVLIRTHAGWGKTTVALEHT